MMHNIRRRQADEHGIGSGGDLGRTRRTAGTARHQRLHRGLVPIENREAVTGIE
jgi:hypothetical protein